MKKSSVLLIGANGSTGRLLSYWLLNKTNVVLHLAGRNLAELECQAIQLRQEFPTKSIHFVFADSTQFESLIKACQNITFVVDATTAVGETLLVAKAALAQRCDYLDFHVDQKTIKLLQSIHSKILEQDRVFITQAGFHPGLPAALVRFAVTKLKVIKKATISMAMNISVKKTSSLYELVDLIMNYRVEIFKNYHWQLATMSDMKQVQFGSRFGKRTCYPIHLEELRILPNLFPLETTGAFVAGFNWFVDYLVIPFAMVLQKIKKGLGRKLIAQLMFWGINNFSTDAQGVEVVLEAEGRDDSDEKKELIILIAHNDAYQFTAISIMGCILQYLNGSIKPGLHLMGQIVTPDLLLKDMEEMGVTIQMRNI